MDGSLHILLVEDDPTSARFLIASLEALPACIDHADTYASAVELADRHPHDLWLIDARLPDGDGISLLRQLRGQGLTTPALAHTASSSQADLDALLSGGFTQVLRKPLPADAVRSGVIEALGRRQAFRVSEDRADAHALLPPVWDQDAALRALNGNAEHVAQLRVLFLADLAQAGARLAASWRQDDLAAVEAGLHRLRASCGFVGAARLAAAVTAWQAAPAEVDQRSLFERTLRETLAQLPP